MMRTAILSAMALGLCRSAAAQPGPVFEAASVKWAPPFSGTGHFRVGCNGGPGTTDPGRVVCENYPLSALLAIAFDLQEYQISGPAWLASERYNLTATLPPNTRREDALLMWQDLLTTRFRLSTHRETREMPVYALIVGKNGSKLEAATDGSAPSSIQANPPQPAPSAGSAPPPPGGANRRISGGRLLMEQLVMNVGFYLDRPLIDQTGLTGPFRVLLQWQLDEPTPGLGGRPVPTNLIQAVQDQLGLKLDPRKAPVPVLVIDHAEKTPVEN